MSKEYTANNMDRINIRLECPGDQNDSENYAVKIFAEGKVDIGQWVRKAYQNLGPSSQTPMTKEEIWAVINGLNWNNIIPAAFKEIYLEGVNYNP